MAEPWVGSMAFSWVALTVEQWVEWEVALLVGLRACVRAGQTVGPWAPWKADRMACEMVDAKVAEKGGVKVERMVVKMVVSDGTVAG